MASKMIPMGDRIIVKREEVPDKTQGGILLVSPSQHAEKPREGVVVAVGPGRITEHGEFVPMSIDVGQKVMFAKWMEYGHKENVIVREPDIIGILV